MDTRHNDQSVPGAGAWIASAILLSVAAVFLLAGSAPEQTSHLQPKEHAAPAVTRLAAGDSRIVANVGPVIEAPPLPEPSTDPPAEPVEVVVEPAPETDPEPKPVEVAPAETEKWGTMRGRFVYDGNPPEPKPAKVDKDVDICGKHNLVDESLVVNKENGGLANVVLFLDAKTPPDPHPMYAVGAVAKIMLDNDKCRFEPHVVLLRSGQTLRVGNKDAIGHNAAINAFNNKSINNAVEAGGFFDQPYPNQERVPLPVACTQHPWMKGYLLVRDSPYFAVTDKNGAFEIRNLPVGEWTFRVWHETANYVREVTRDGQPEKLEYGKFIIVVEPGENEPIDIKVSPSLFIKTD